MDNTTTAAIAATTKPIAIGFSEIYLSDLVDGSRPEVIRSLKRQLGDNPDYEQEIDYIKKSFPGCDYEQNMLESQGAVLTTYTYDPTTSLTRVRDRQTGREWVE